VRALLRKDLRWVVFLAVTGVLFHLVIQAAENAADIWIFPQERYGWIGLWFHAVAATILGLLATVSEDLTQTREYLVHRPVSPARLFWTRQLSATIVLASWVLLVPVLHLAGTLLWRSDAELVDSGRLWLFIADGGGAFLFYALAVLSGSVVRRPLLAFLLAASTSLIAAVLLLVILFAGHLPVALSFVVPLFCVGIAALLLVGAERAQRHRPDPDRPWPADRLRWTAPLLAAVVAVASSFAVTALQLVSRQALLEEYPMVIDHPAGPVLAVETDDRRALVQVDDQHRPIRPLSVEDPPRLWRPRELEPFGGLPRPRSDSFPQYGWQFRGQMCSDPVSTEGRRAFPCSDGYVHLVRTRGHAATGSFRPSYRRLGKGPDNRPFSASAVWVSDNGVVLVSDPADSGVWLLDPREDPAAFGRLELPGGDRFVGRARLMVPHPPYHAVGRPRLAVHGARGVYLWNGGDFTVAPPDMAVEPRYQAPRASYPARAAVAFPLTLSNPQGQTIFHQYRPLTGAEKAWAFVTIAASVLRPPVISALSLLASDRAFTLGSSLVLDSVVATGQRQALLPLALLAVLLAAVTYFRLRRRGASPARRRFWVLAVALGGLPIFLCQQLIETRRAWLPMPAVPPGKPLPVLLIQGA
jgi:hypothetical protein